ncbi:DUF2812 domain-containing protein [Paenibacillus koleovorans]|uniref:DUF2812 domain-containing protein n=1 Tax=Paenibacillus koleovorans TaxID=121608 RepID=UPI000FD7FB59|nr:DUF2812 domain-containing protein [Paenibacillus koleovorans]
MDYQDVMKAEQVKEYRALYADAGWEFVGTSANWQYFRRPYVEGDTTELYSDKESIRSLYKKVQSMFGIVALANLSIFIMNTTRMFSSSSEMESLSTFMKGLSVFQLIAILLLGYGVLRFQKLIRQHSD